MSRHVLPLADRDGKSLAVRLTAHWLHFCRGDLVSADMKLSALPTDPSSGGQFAWRSHHGCGYLCSMPADPITLEVLPAGYGDSLLISCPTGQRTWRMLIDTGPDECWPTLKARLAKIPKNRKGQRVIDVLVVTHIDHDHIGGVAQLLGDKELGLQFGDIWFNAPSLRRSKGVAEGQGLADLLGAGDMHLPWNMAFQGDLCVTGPGTKLFTELPAKRGLPKLTVLSPTQGTLNVLFKSWDKEMEKLQKRAVEPVQARGQTEETIDLAALASKVTAVDQAAPNGSSIAILLEHRGASVLLGADVFPTVLTAALKDLALSRKSPKGVKVDAFKLSHHGSKANTTFDLLKAVQADHYIVSTNGAIFGHPDDEAIARVITAGGRRPTLWFNYSTAKTKRWAQTDLQIANGYVAVMPVADGAGVTLRLGSKQT
jgi:beta-lactamase superfamily II metal-dependent hydrolase